MMVIDARGYSCPIPVVKTKEAIDNNPKTPVAVLVESEVSRENVSRLARSRGYSIKVERMADGFRLLLNPSGK